VNEIITAAGTITGRKEAPLTMSSREIAEVVGSRHDSVKRTILRLVERGVIQQPPMVEAEKINDLGLTQYVQEYHLVKRDSFIVVAQLCPEFTARIVDRWQQLEEEVSKQYIVQNLSDPKVLHGLLLEQLEARIALEAKTVEQQAKIEEMEPQVKALHRISAGGDEHTLTDAAKILGLRPRADFIPWLASCGFIYKRGSSKS